MPDFFLANGSYLGIFVVLVLTGCGLPVPEEVPIVFAGVVSSQGHLDPSWAFVACLLGALAGDAAMYAIGYHFGHNLLVMHPRFAKFVGAQREEYFEQAIERHAFKVMLLARFMVGIRGPVYLAAGVVRMPFRKFLLSDLVCATLVVGLFFSLSFAYGEKIVDLIRDAEMTITLVVLAILGCVLLWWLRRRRHRLLDAAIEAEARLGEAGSDRPSEQESDKSRVERRA